MTEVIDQGVRGVNNRTGRRTELPADSVVIAVGLKPHAMRSRHLRENLDLRSMKSETV